MVSLMEMDCNLKNMALFLSSKSYWQLIASFLLFELTRKFPFGHFETKKSKQNEKNRYQTRLVIISPFNL